MRYVKLQQRLLCSLQIAAHLPILVYYGSLKDLKIYFYNALLSLAEMCKFKTKANCQQMTMSICCLPFFSVVIPSSHFSRVATQL